MAGLIQSLLIQIGSLKWPVDLVTAIINNETCSNTLFFDNFLDRQCLSLSISKALGYAMMAGACFYKVPVIMKIVAKKGGDGLSMPGVYMETSAYLANFTYNLLRGNPISTYGELFATIIQNFIIIALIWLWGINGKKFSVLHILSMLALGGGYCYIIGAVIPVEYHSLIATYSFVVLTLSRIPQIIANATSGDVGVQSPFTAGNAALGAFIKVFIVFVETKDLVLVGGAAVSLTINAIVLTQIMLLRSKGSPSDTAKVTRTSAGRSKESEEPTVADTVSDSSSSSAIKTNDTASTTKRRGVAKN